MLKFKDYVLLAIVIISLGIIHYNDRIIAKQLEELNKHPAPEYIAKPVEIKQVAKIEDIEPEYLIPAPKEQVEAVISQYYSKTVVIDGKNEKTTPAVKIQPKKVKPSNINVNSQEIIDKIAVYIKKKEGFSAKAYKDNTQYSIGYGTRARSKTEVITVKEANIRLYKHIKQVIIPSFNDVTFQSIEQVYSAIDFSYNLGHNRFKQDIVRENGVIDCSKMMAYNKTRDKNGNLVYNEGLAQRRFENFLACASYEIIEE